MDGLQFEHRCAELLRYRGFHEVVTRALTFLHRKTD